MAQNTDHPIRIIKRRGRSYYGCPDCGRKFNSLTKVDDHGCKYGKARAAEIEPNAEKRAEDCGTDPIDERAADQDEADRVAA
jgi:hypothetical protein